ncbi:glycosyltransferase family 9 protein, partial [Gemmatimonadota bacterium]
MANSLELAGRRFLTAIVSRFIRPRAGEAWSWAERPPERILLVRHDDRIGNLILMKPLLQGVRQLWPEAETAVLIGPRYAQVYQEEPEVDRLWILEKRRILGNPFHFFRFISQLRKSGYDMAIDCSHMHSFSLTGASLTYFSGAPVRVAYDRENAGTFCNLLVEPLRAEHHESDILLNLLRPFVEELPDTEMRIHLSPEETEDALGRRMACTGEKGVLLGIHIGGRGSKKWAVERYESLIGKILELYDISIAILCGPGEEEEAIYLREHL